MLDDLFADPIQRAIRVLDQCFNETHDRRFLLARAQLQPPVGQGRLKGSATDDRPHLLRMARLLQRCPRLSVSRVAKKIAGEIGGQSEEATAERFRRKWRQQGNAFLAEIVEQAAFRRMAEELRAVERSRLVAVPQPPALDEPAGALGSPSLGIRR
jgi:hypothetical protein